MQPPEAPQKSKRKERKISEKEARELFRQVDEILRFVSKDTKLPIKHAVKRELVGRERVREYVMRRSREDEDTRRLQRTEIVLKKFGLLPRGFELEKYLADVLEEQVSGFYDSRTKTVYLLDWVEPETQKAVLAHELTHALQDQNYDLDKLLKKDIKSEDQTKALQGREPIEIRGEERSTARHAVVEGQAMVVLIDYLLAPGGRSLADSPMIGEMMKQSTVRRTEEFPLFERAPLYLRESLLFAYSFGMDFVEEMLHRGGRDLAFAGVLKDPPLNTRQVMDPKTYASGEKIAPLVLPDMHPLLGEKYEPYDVGNIGQFDTFALIKQYADQKAAEKTARHWRGAGYYAALPKAAPGAKVKPADPAALALLYLSRWASAEAAAQFAQRYAGLLLHKYKFAQRLGSSDQKPERACFECPGGVRYATNEGPVVIHQQGEQVLVLEGFDEATAAKLSAAVLPQAPADGAR